MARTLSAFSISQEADGYVLHIEDEDGETIEMSATDEQLEEMLAAIEEQLEMEEGDDLALDDEDEPVDDEE